MQRRCFVGFSFGVPSWKRTLLWDARALFDVLREGSIVTASVYALLCDIYPHAVELPFFWDTRVFFDVLGEGSIVIAACTHYCVVSIRTLLNDIIECAV